MNIHAAEHLDKARIVMVHDLAVTQVFGRDLGHFLISQGEVPDVDVLLHPLHMDGLGDDGHVPLGTPAEGHLGRDLAVLFAGLGQLRVGEDAMLALRQRSPRLRHHAVCLHIVDALLLNEEGVLFHLIHSRDDLYIFAQVGQNGRVEVGYADGFRHSVLAGFLNATIHSKIIAHRLMQQNQINRDHIQLFQRGFHRLISDLLVLHILDPDLGPDEQFLTGGQAICDGTGHTFA